MAELPRQMNMQPRRILIVRLSAIGDVIQTMPIACALRERFPDATLVWAVEQRAGTLLQGHEALDELIMLPRGWLKSLGEVRRVRRQLREFNFDVAVDVQSLSKSAILAWLSGARRRIGFGNPGGREFSKWLNNERVDPKTTHVIDRYLELLGPLGIHQPAVRFQVPELEADRLTAERIIGESALGDGYAIINPGAGWPSKLWPTERFAAVARHLGETWRLPTLVVWGGGAEREAAERIVAEGGEKAMMSPSTSLTELAALARRAKLFIGSDTGPLHLAAAVDTPCVGLYGPWPAARHGPYGPRHIALQKMFYEGPTRGRRTAPPIYMESITTEMVCDACDEILQIV